MAQDVTTIKNREITQELERLKMALSKLNGLLSSLPVELEPVLTPERPAKDVAQPGKNTDSPLGQELAHLATDVERMGTFVGEMMLRIAV